MNILITGSSGLIGQALKRTLSTDKNKVYVLQRNRTSTDPFWDIPNSIIDLKKLSFDIVIHLAGENVASRWTAKKKKSIEDSRVSGTKLLCQALIQTKQFPKIFLSASGAGFYGETQKTPATENTPVGEGFLAGVCQKWEDETKELQQAGTRVLHLRTGMVLSKYGGALAKMTPAFRLGLGGVLGKGSQYMSWITLKDYQNAISHIIRHEDLIGSINMVSPTPLTNKNFTKILGRSLNRPTLFPVPRWAIHLLFGEMGKELLLQSSRVLPKKLIDSGFVFTYSTLSEALSSKNLDY